MAIKILSIDDSKSVHIVIRKMLKDFSLDLFDAYNGVEGLKMAKKILPDLILLDVTMPVMDGVEMLNLLKKDQLLKSIPVVMLTAEAGKDNVMKIARLGIRDYIVKPFDAKTLVTKLDKILQIKKHLSASSKKRSLWSDPVQMSIISEEEENLSDFRNGLKNTSWKFDSISPTDVDETLNACLAQTPDIIAINLALPDTITADLYRKLKSKNETRHLIVFGLAPTRDTHATKVAQERGYHCIIQKPFDFLDVEYKVIKWLNLNTTQKYFRFENGNLKISLPSHMIRSIVTDMSKHLKHILSNASAKGIQHIHVDAHQSEICEQEHIDMLMEIEEQANQFSMARQILCPDSLLQKLKSYNEFNQWTINGKHEVELV